MTNRRNILAQFIADQPWLVVMLCLSLVAHVAAAAFLHVHSGQTAQPRPLEPLVLFVGEADASLADATAIRDPSLAALPSAHGFSASLFPEKPALPYEPPFLDQPPRPLKTAPPAAARPRPDAAIPPADTVTSRARPVSQETAPDQAAQSQTRVVIPLPLAERAPAVPASLPQLEGVAPPQSTALRVAVDKDGRVRYAMIEESSGFAAADRMAVGLVSSWRFAPREQAGDAVDWGEVRFFWAGGAESAPAAAPKGGAR
jgi:TonB family protein